MTAEAEKLDHKELFRELLTVYPGAQLEDYYKAGLWQDILKIDLDLIKAHRREGGAPEPIPIEEVVMPEIPKAAAMPAKPAMPAPVGNLAMRAPMGGVVGLAKPAQPLQRIAPGNMPKAGVSTAAKPLMTPVAKAGTISGAAAAGAAAVAAGATAGGPSAELRQIALFIQRWKLEAAKAKLLLARLTPIKRRWVMSNFKGAGTLEQYIQQCERTQPWEKAGSPAVGGAVGGAAAGGVGLARPAAAKPTAGGPLRPAAPKIGGTVPTTAAAGLKRPLGAATGLGVDPKRPKLGSAAPMPGARAPAPKVGQQWGPAPMQRTVASGMGLSRPASAPSSAGSWGLAKPTIGGGGGYAPAGGMRPTSASGARPPSGPPASAGKAGGKGAPVGARVPVGAKPTAGYLRPTGAKAGQKSLIRNLLSNA